MNTTELKKAALIVNPNGSSQWFLQKLGTFVECRFAENQIKKNFKQTKVIYQFNLVNYGI